MDPDEGDRHRCRHDALGTDVGDRWLPLELTRCARRPRRRAEVIDRLAGFQRSHRERCLAHAPGSSRDRDGRPRLSLIPR